MLTSMEERITNLEEIVDFTTELDTGGPTTDHNLQLNANVQSI